MIVRPPNDVPDWFGDDASTVRILARIWGTVDMERALDELRAGAAPGPALDRPIGADPSGAVADPLLGAMVLILPSRDGPSIALAEPSTEGRLAATLARRGEGHSGSYLMAPFDLGRLRMLAAAAGARLSRPEVGPFGVAVVVLGDRIGGSLVVLVQPAAVPSRP